MGGACHKTSICCQPFLEPIFEFSVFCLEFDTWLKARTRPTRLSRSLGNSSNTSGLIFVPQADLRPEKKQRPETDPQYDRKHWQLVSPLFTMLLHLWQDWQLSYNINWQNHIIWEAAFWRHFSISCTWHTKRQTLLMHARTCTQHTHAHTNNKRTHTHTQTNKHKHKPIHAHSHTGMCICTGQGICRSHTYKHKPIHAHSHTGMCTCTGQGRCRPHTHTNKPTHRHTHTNTSTYTCMHIHIHAQRTEAETWHTSRSTAFAHGLWLYSPMNLIHLQAYALMHSLCCRHYSHYQGFLVLAT